MQGEGIAQVIQAAVDLRVDEDGASLAYIYLRLHTWEGASLERAMLFFSERDKPQVNYNAEKHSIRALLPMRDFENLHRVVRLEKELYLEWKFGTAGEFYGLAFRSYPRYSEAFPTDEPHPAAGEPPA